MHSSLPEHSLKVSKLLNFQVYEYKNLQLYVFVL